MKHLIVTLLLLVAAGSLAFAAKHPPAKQLMTTAQKQADLFNGSGEPFQLDMDFIADPQTGSGPMQGHFELKWEAKDRWWRQIDMGGYRQTDIRVGKKLYTSRNSGFTPIAIREFLSLLEFAQVDRQRSELIVKEKKRCKKDGLKALCIKGDLVSDENEHHDVILNAKNGTMLVNDWSASPDQRRKEEFSNWVALDKYRYYPHKLELKVNGDMIVTASVTNLATTPFDETLLIPPEGAIASR
jgi:hypothetical protein